jgi:hypothetical protein
MPEHALPTKAEVESYLRDRRNWGRWGADDQVGAVNLITPQKRLEAVSLVRTGRAVSLSRELPKTPAPNNPTPAQHFMRVNPRDGGASVVDYYGAIGRRRYRLSRRCHRARGAAYRRVPHRSDGGPHRE